MDAAIVARTEADYTIQVRVPYHASMLEAEDAIQGAVIALPDLHGGPLGALLGEGRPPRLPGGGVRGGGGSRRI